MPRMRQAAGLTPQEWEHYRDRLQRDYESMQALETRSGISFTTVGDLPPRRYRVEIRVISPARVTKRGAPVNVPLFRFDIRLPPDYPAVPPVCTTTSDSENPFHPHFTRPLFFSGPSRWKDYRPHDRNELLADFVRRIAQSLQYCPDFINEDETWIGHYTAFEWYLDHKNDRPPLFPIPQTRAVSSRQRPESDPEQHRTFEIVQRVPPAAAAPAPPPTPPPAVPIPAPEPRPPAKKFEIASVSDGYRVTQRAVPNASVVPQLSTRRNYGVDDRYELYFKPAAHAELASHVAWGSSTEANRVEQGGLLLGNVFTDPDEGVTFGVVHTSIPAELAKGSGGYLLMDHDAWKAMIDRADQIADAASGAKLQVIGWYHTHPNELSVFLSSTDQATQRRMFGNEWQFAVVLNPQRREWRVFHGKDILECRGHVLQ
jgi:proteasome lid subunit RPN8/RPN11